MTIIIIPNEPNPNMTGRHYGIAKALTAAGHTVHTVVWDLPQLQTGFGRIAHLWRSLTARSTSYEAITLHKFRRLPYFWPIINGVLFRRQLRQLFASTGADVVFAMSYTNETLLPRDLPYIYDLADDYAAPAEVFGSVLYSIMFAALGVRRTMRRHCQGALAVTAVSETLCAYARRYNAQVYKLPNGVEIDILQSIGAQPVRPHSLVYVTGFGPWSRPLELMDAVRALRTDIPDVSLTLVGEGSEVPAMQQYIAAHNAGSYIQYRGFIHDRRKVFRLIAAHEVGLNISEKNAWRDAAHPMKVIEYSALGKKVVSTNLQGVVDLHYPNIFLFSDDGSQSDLRAALRQALATKPDVATYQALQKQVWAEYDWKHIIAQLTSIITARLADQHTQRTIVHATPAYPPNLGGLEKVVQVLAATESELGNSVSVVTSNKGVAKGVVPKDAIPVRRLRSFVVANTTIMPGLLAELLRIPKGAVVHLHVTQAFTPEMVWLASRIKRFRYIAHIHLDVPPSGIAGFLLRLYKPLCLRRVLRAAQAVVVFTADQRRVMCKRYGLPDSRVVIVPNGVETAFFYDKPRRVHRQPRLLFVGRLGYQKNIPLLLEALQGVSEYFETTLLGDGELRDQLQTQARSLGLHNVTFAGRADGQALLDYYKQADIFVLPSEREGMPLVLLEAMAMGLPIVATDVTGNRDVVAHNRNGMLVPLHDAAALRGTLLMLRDNARYARLHTQARLMANDYTWEKIVRRFQALYDGELV